MLSGASYDRITPEGLWITTGEGAQLIEADTVVICAGQERARDLADALDRLGCAHHVIGGADVAAELDAKRAIDQGVRLGVAL